MIPIPVSRMRTSSRAGVLFGREPDVPARRREFHSVVEHIGKHLHEPRAVTVDTNRRRGQLHLHRVPRCRGECRDRFDGGGHQRREVERFTTQLDFVGRDTGHVQQVVDESHELPDLTLDHLSSVFRDRASAVNFQGLQREPYRCQRVPELVREHREEFVLALILLLEFGGTVTNPQLQLSIQRFRVVFGSLQTVDEIVVVKSQLERGVNRQMESPACQDSRDSKHRTQQSHHQMAFISHTSQAKGGENTRRDQEREERLRPRRQSRRTTEHDSAHCEYQENLIQRPG